MIDFDKLNIGDKVIIHNGSVGFDYGFRRRKWSIPDMVIGVVSDKKKTQFTVGGSSRFSRTGNEMRGSGKTAHMIDETTGYNGKPLIDLIVSQKEIREHREKVKKISRAMMLVNDSNNFNIVDFDSIDDAVIVAEAIISAYDVFVKVAESAAKKGAKQ